MNYEYSTMPFSPVVKAGPKMHEQISQMMAQAINTASVQGWEYMHLETVTVFEQPGCLAVLGGGKMVARGYDMLVFRRPRS